MGKTCEYVFYGLIIAGVTYGFISLIPQEYFAPLGLILGFIGSICIAIPFFKTKKQREKLSATYWGKNPHLNDYLIQDARWCLFGLILLAIGFVLQFFGLIF
jgi:hypothetical protein